MGDETVNSRSDVQMTFRVVSKNFPGYQQVLMKVMAGGCAAWHPAIAGAGKQAFNMDGYLVLFLKRPEAEQIA
jgi:hypothetical protein